MTIFGFLVTTCKHIGGGNILHVWKTMEVKDFNVTNSDYYFLIRFMLFYHDREFH